MTGLPSCDAEWPAPAGGALECGDSSQSRPLSAVSEPGKPDRHPATGCGACAVHCAARLRGDLQRRGAVAHFASYAPSRRSGLRPCSMSYDPSCPLRHRAKSRARLLPPCTHSREAACLGCELPRLATRPDACECGARLHAAQATRKAMGASRTTSWIEAGPWRHRFIYNGGVY